MNVVAIIQARMGSSRLPGKVLMPILSKPLLQFQIERIRKSKLINKLIIATTHKSIDNPIIDLCEDIQCDYYRGEEHDVLRRYYEAATNHHADVIVRITGDCPLIDPIEIDKVIQAFLDRPTNDYVSNVIQRTYPRGMDVEVFPYRTLTKLYNQTQTKKDREHVTISILDHLTQYQTLNVLYAEQLNHIRLTVDTIEDFELIKRILEYMYPRKSDFRLVDIINLLKKNPDWLKINAHINQKELE